MPQQFTKKEIQDYATAQGWRGDLPASWCFEEELAIWNKHDTMEEGYRTFKVSRNSWAKCAEANVRMNNGQHIGEQMTKAAWEGRLGW